MGTGDYLAHEIAVTIPEPGTTAIQLICGFCVDERPDLPILWLVTEDSPLTISQETVRDMAQKLVATHLQKGDTSHDICA